MNATTVGTDVAGKIASITGAGPGIGRAAVLGLAEASAGLILPARSGGQLAETGHADRAVRSGRTDPHPSR
jgi:NAD(P)-dependent dehydrogenase (short-subunit alcohol dehydrogenase family)